METAVLQALSTYILQPDLQLAHQQLLQSQQANHFKVIEDQKADLNKRLAGVRRRLANTTAAIAEAGHSPALLETLARLESEAADLRAQIASLDRQLAAPLPDLSPADLADQLAALRLRLTDPAADPAALRTLLRGLLSRVTIDRDGPAVRGELIYYLPPP